MALCVWLEDEMQRVNSCAGVTERPCGYANTSQGKLLYQKQQFRIFNKRMSLYNMHTIKQLASANHVAFATYTGHFKKTIEQKESLPQQIFQLKTEAVIRTCRRRQSKRTLTLSSRSPVDSPSCTLCHCITLQLSARNTGIIPVNPTTRFSCFATSGVCFRFP